MTGTAPLVIDREAVACLELSIIARGIVALDQMAKRAATTIVAARTLSSGRYLILASGALAEVEEALAAGVEAARDDLVDHIILRDPAHGLRDALASSRLPPALDESLAIVETATVSALFGAADRALKELDLSLLEVRLGAGLSGRGVFTVTGPLHRIEALGDIVRSAVPEDRILRIETIAQPHPDLPARLLGAEPALARGVL